MLEDGVDGGVEAYAYASLLEPPGLRFVVDPEEVFQEVHPVHFTVTCQCVALTLVPVLRT